MNGCIVVAGGKGTRMGSDIAKQFMSIEGVPVFIHTLIHLSAYDRDMFMVLVIPSHIEESKVMAVMREYITDEILLAHISIVHGGPTRSESVYNGLCAIPDEIERVGVHDAVRPFVRKEMLKRLYESQGNAVIPIIPVIDSLRLLGEGGNSIVLDRSKVVGVQTPQVFDRVIIKDAYDSYIDRLKSGDISFTDDASLYTTYTGNDPILVDGDIDNIKITTPKDMATAISIIHSMI